MTERNARLCLVAGLILPLLLACGRDAERADPRALPYRLERVREFRQSIFPVDLNADGRDELLSLKPLTLYPPDARFSALQLLPGDGRVWEQLNFEGFALPPRFLDLDADGRSEILVPVLRGDSLFLTVVSTRGERRFSFLLATGQPRVEPDAMLPWDPRIIEFYAVDTDGDGNAELVTVINTDFARLPRGVLVHRLPDGAVVGEAIVGASIGGTYLDDFDGDGVPEIVASTLAVENGAEAGGFDDRQSYLLVFSLAPQVRVAWSRQMGGRGTHTALAYADFDGDGRREILARVSPGSGTEPSRLEIIEPGSWRTVRRRSFSDLLSVAIGMDLDGDSRAEIVVLRKPADIWVLDSQLEVVHRRTFASELGGVFVGPDLNGDGIEELLAFTPERLLVLGADLQVKASQPHTRALLPSQHYTGRLRRGLGAAPLLLTSDAGTVVAWELLPNRLYPLYRYGPGLLLLTGMLMLGGMTTGVLRLRQRSQRDRAIQALAVEMAPYGLLLLDRKGRVERSNQTLREWLGLRPHAGRRAATVEEVLAGAPRALAFCRTALAADPPHHLEAFGPFRLNGEERTLRLQAEPVLAKVRGGPFWLVRFEDQPREAEIEQARTWVQMAKQVAHDFRKPLSTIGHHLGRMQREYRRQMPEAAPPLDARAEEIFQLVSMLRQKADRFRKIVFREPVLEEVELNAFVRAAAAALQCELPADIHLRLSFAADAPVVRLDRQLMNAVLANLVSNAVDALPDGGAIHVSTGSVVGTQLSPLAGPRDYGCIEVRDDGVGIPAEIRDRLFEPGFTTHEGGWGLGLTYVKTVMDAHQGIIAVESEPGAGSAFTLYLPTAG